MKYLYLVQHFLPFPISEYSGIWVVIAKDDNQCFDLIVAKDQNEYPEYYNRLREYVIKARRFSLVDDPESSVIEECLT